MKKILVLFAALATVATAQTVSAQNNNGKEPHVNGYITNGFWDNWEIQAGAGPSFTLGSKSNGVGDVTSWNVYAGVMKWFHPIFGVRVALDGGRHSYTAISTGTKSSPSYLYLHPDFVVNLSNWIGGYKERVYNANIYLGGGYYVSSVRSSSTRERGFVGDVGLQNRFNLGKKKAVSLDLNIQYTLGKCTLFHDMNSNHLSQSLNVFAGVTYRFNKRGYDRNAMSKAEAEAVMEKAMKAEKKAGEIKAENAELQKKINQVKAAM